MVVYSVVIRLYILLIRLISPFHSKAYKLIAGRRHFFKHHEPDKNIQYIWFHCASLGEFEQARPIIEKIKSEHPQKKILLSFFSSSGYEIRKEYPLADKVIYLPFDSEINANMFFGTFKITLAIFVKYDLWPYYLKELLSRKIPVYLTSATFRKDHWYFRWYGHFMLKMIKRFNQIFVQDQESYDLLVQHAFNNVKLSGDVRVDRVIQIQKTDETMEEIERFLDHQHCWIFGSIYPAEINLIKYVAQNSQWKIILAPHQIDDSTIQFFKKQLAFSRLYSEANFDSDVNILIVDHVGSLNKLYKYASGVYIGGGFGKTIHNILEPAVWGVPVYFGPHFSKFPEAKSMLDKKMAFSSPNGDELAKLMCIREKEFDKMNYVQLSTEWFSVNSGATSLIYNYLCANI